MPITTRIWICAPFPPSSICTTANGRSARPAILGPAGEVHLRPGRPARACHRLHRFRRQHFVRRHSEKFGDRPQCARAYRGAGRGFDSLRRLRHRPPARIRRAILDKNVRVPEDAMIGYDLEKDKHFHHVTESGIVVVEGDRSAGRGRSDFACEPSAVARPRASREQVLAVSAAPAPEPFTRSLERMNRFQEPEARALIADLALPAGSRGLDVGCGVGLDALWLAGGGGTGRARHRHRAHRRARGRGARPRGRGGRGGPTRLPHRRRHRPRGGERQLRLGRGAATCSTTSSTPRARSRR